MPQALSIVADIGGTNTRVALAEGSRIDRAGIRRFANADRSGIAAILADYLAMAGHPVCSGACVAVAGPIHDGKATMTNRDWTIERGAIGRATGARRIVMINDLQAQGHGLGHLTSKNLRGIIPASASPCPRATRLVIGIGTGFNAAAIHDTPAGKIVTASECGHAGLPVRDAAGLRLAQFLERTHDGFASVEDVLSGRGLEGLHRWLTAKAGPATGLAAPDIIAAIASGGERRAAHAGRIFVRLLGAVAGDLALIHLPFGGIYLTGGVARALAPHLERLGFADAFRDKGRFSGFLNDFPVLVVEDDFAALKGCAAFLDAQV